MTDTILTCLHVTKRFVSRGRTTDVLSDVSLEIRRGGIAVIQGRSGTGKSTLLQILAGLDRPTTGRVEMAGKSLDGLSADDLAAMRRQTMGFVFQNFNLIPSWTAGQNVEAALIHTRLTRPQRSRKVRDMLESLELGDRIDHLPSELSIGQQQRVAIARALIHAPAIVFADEPTGDVDPQTAQSIMNCLTSLVRKNATTLVVCTHGEFSPNAADQHYVLHDGKVAPSTPGSGSHG
jgi:putative ABC transport system ATP-binding protein